MDKLVIKSHRRRVLKEGSNLSKISSNVQNEPEGRDPGAEEADAESGHQPECEPMTEFTATGLGGGVGPGGGSRRRAGDGEGEGGPGRFPKTRVRGLGTDPGGRGLEQIFLSGTRATLQET